MTRYKFNTPPTAIVIPQTRTAHYTPPHVRDRLTRWLNIAAAVWIPTAVTGVIVLLTTPTK